MNHIPPVDWKSQSTCGDPVGELFARKSIFERLQPIMSELLRSIRGQQSSDISEAPLPAYCYNILKIFRKTYLKILPEPDRCVLREPGQTDWDALGRMLGLGLHCLSFVALDLKVIIDRQKLLPEERARLATMIEAIANENAKNVLWEAFTASNKAANACGAETVARLTNALQKGRKGFIDGNGQFVGESSRANLYWFLLLIWPEIRELQGRRPPITRVYFYDWLQPYADCGLVCVPHFAHLVDVCETIDLKFKGVGAPRRK